MLEINNITKTFNKLKALQEVTLKLNPGHIYGLVGPNGCGKTTLIKSILGLVTPDSGTVLINGKDTARDWTYRAQIGYLPQNPDYPSQITLKELLELLSEIRNQAPVRTTELLKLFNLEKVYHRPFGELSGGMKQRVGAIAALTFDSPILILDEPTVGLDPLILVPFKKLIQQEAKRGKLILLVSHVLVEMEQMADQFIFMIDGKIGLQGDLQTILRDISTPNHETHNLETAVVRWMETV
jgi:Cu-processing system ATP-binding protein